MNQDGKSYYHSGPESLLMMTEQDAQDECSRVGLGQYVPDPHVDSIPQLTLMIHSGLPYGRMRGVRVVIYRNLVHVP